MEQSKVAKILNAIIILGLLSIIIYTLLVKRIKNIMISVLLTAMLISIIATEIKHISTKRNNRLNLKKQELNHKENCMWFFLTEPQIKVYDFFSKLLSKYFLITNKTRQFIFAGDIAFAPYFQSETLNQNNLLKLIQSANSCKIKQLIIFCSQTEELQSVLKHINNLKITILNGYETYGLMKKKNMFPVEINADIVPNKLSKRIVFSTFFAKSNAKPFLFCGIWLFFACFFTPYKLYYCIFAGIFLIISLIIMFFAKKVPQTSMFEELLNSRNEQELS